MICIMVRMSSCRGVPQLSPLDLVQVLPSAADTGADHPVLDRELYPSIGWRGSSAELSKWLGQHS
jgi:hypothetical protein